MRSISDSPQIDAATHSLIDTTLSAGKSLRLTITTTSMLPMLAPGDQIMVRGARAEDLRAGDIALLRVGNTHVAHRLIARYDSGEWITKGDHNAEADSDRAAARVCGVVVAVQSDEHRAMRSCQMAAVNRLLAHLSRKHVGVGQMRSPLLRRIAAKIVCGAMRAAATCARRFARSVIA